MSCHENQRFHDFDWNYSESPSCNLFILPDKVEIRNHSAEVLKQTLEFILECRFKLLRFIIIGKIVLLIHVDSGEQKSQVKSSIL